MGIIEDLKEEHRFLKKHGASYAAFRVERIINKYEQAEEEFIASRSDHRECENIDDTGVPF